MEGAVHQMRYFPDILTSTDFEILTPVFERLRADNICTDPDRLARTIIALYRVGLVCPRRLSAMARYLEARQTAFH